MAYLIPSEEEKTFPLLLSRLYEAQVNKERIFSSISLYSQTNKHYGNFYAGDASLEFDDALVTITTFTANNRRRHIICFQSQTVFNNDF